MSPPPNGGYNTANGFMALFNNITGALAPSLNTNGDYNTADGVDALCANRTGSHNIALGFQAGSNLTTGNHNIGIGNSGVAGDANSIRIGTQGTQIRTFVAGIYPIPVPYGTNVIVNSNGQLGVAVSSARFKGRDQGHGQRQQRRVWRRDNS